VGGIALGDGDVSLRLRPDHASAYGHAPNAADFMFRA